MATVRVTITGLREINPVDYIDREELEEGEDAVEPELDECIAQYEESLEDGSLDLNEEVDHLRGMVISVVKA